MIVSVRANAYFYYKLHTKENEKYKKSNNDRRC